MYEITINYGSDFNILKIHNQIVKNYINNEEIDEKIKKLESDLEKETLKSIRNYIKSKIEDYKKISNNPEYDIYLEETKEEIDKYIEYSKKNSLFSKKIDIDVVVPLMDDYLSKIKKFVNVQMYYDTEYICQDCIKLYEICGCSKKIESNVTNVKLKNEYENEVNFIKALMKYQGRQGIKFEESLFDRLDSYFTKYGLPISKEIKSKELNEDGTRGNTSIKMLFDALYEIKKTELYSDVNLLCHEYWGWVLPDISEFYDQILIDYRKTQRVFETLQKERSSCLNLPYRIFKHLQIYNIKIKSKDFRLPTTQSILKSQDQLWKQMCLQTGLKFISTV